MSKGIGGKIQKTAVGILIGLLVIGFAVWGVSDVFTPQVKNAVLSVGKQDISTREFNDSFRRELRVMGRDSGQVMTNEEAYNQGIHNQVLQSLMTEAVIGLDADELGIGVNRRTARDVVKDIPSFQDEITGKFSEKKLDEVLRSNSITREDFETDIFRSLRRQQTIPAIIGGLEAPFKFASQRYKFLTEQRKAQVLTVNAKAIDAIQDPDDETLKSYIENNAGDYTAPQYRRVTLLRIEPFDITPNIEVTEDEIKAAFEYKIELGDIGSGETRSVTQITATDEITAQKAVDRLNAGESAATIASSLGLVEPIEYIDSVPDDIIDPETSKASFEMAEGEARTLLGSLGNWYAIYVPKINPAIIPDYDNQRDEIQTNLINDKAQEKLFDLTGEIEDALSDGLTLEEVAEKTNLPLSSLDFIDRSGTTEYGVKMSGISRVPGIAEDDIILREIFTNDLGYETDLFETSAKGWAAIRVDDIKDSAMRPYETVKDTATASWKTQQIDEALTEKIIALSRRIDEGETLDGLAVELGAGATLEDVILVRSTPGDKIGPALTVGLLDGAIGDIERGDGVTLLTKQIAVLTAIVSNQDALAGRFADVVREQATNAISSDLQFAYQQAILKKNPLQEYPNNVRQTLGITTP